MKDTFFKELALDETLYDFLQEFAENGVFCFFKEQPKEVWIDRKLKSVNGLNNNEYNFISNILSENSIAVLTDYISKGNIAQKKNLQLTFNSPKNVLLSFDCFLKKIKAEEGILVVIAVGKKNNDSNNTHSDSIFLNSHSLNKNELLIKLYEESPAMMHSLDAEGRIKYVSNQWLKKFGYSRDEVIGRKSTDFLTYASREYALNVTLPAFFRDGHCEDIHYEMVKKNGDTFHVSLSGKKINEEFTGETLSLAVIQDITNEVQAKIANERSESLIADILNNTKIHMWAFDGEQYTYMNKEWFDYTGQVNKLPLNIDRWTNYVHPEDLETAVNVWLKHWETKTAHENYFRLKRHDGVYRSFYCYAAPVWNKNGDFTFFQGYNIDITDRLHAEKALKESRERLRLSIEAANIGLWDWNLVTNEINHNEKWAEMIGYTLDEVTPMTEEIWLKLCSLEESEKLNNAITEHIKNDKEHFECELKLRHKKGHWIWVLDRGKVMERTADGKPLRMSGTHIDITERKIAEFALKESEKRLHKLTQNVPGIIYQYEMTQEGKSEFTFLSKNIKGLVQELDLNDVSKEPFIGIDYIHPDDKQKVYEAIQYSREHLTPFDIVCRTIRPNGELEWYNAKSKPEKQEDGTVIWYGIIQNINEKMRYKQEIERLAHIAENTSDMLITTDKEGRVSWANGIHFKVLGYKPEEIIGKRPTQKLKTSNEYKDKLIRLEQALINHEPFNEIIILYVKDNQPIWINYNVTPIFSEDGNFLYSIVGKTDVSKLIKQQKELKELLKMSSEQNKRLKDYSYITSHNIRSNVASILGLVELLTDEPIQSLYLEKLDVAAKNLDITIRNINQLLQLEKEFIVTEKSEYNVSVALERILVLNNKQIKAKGVLLNVKLQSKLVVKTVPAYFDSIVQNLLTNALKYGITETKKDILISVTKDNTSLKIMVQDYGLGVDLDKFGDKLFDLGTRFHNVSRGQGLGLFMTLRQVEYLEGEIHVESKENKGATFIVTLPL